MTLTTFASMLLSTSTQSMSRVLRCSGPVAARSVLVLAPGIRTASTASGPTPPAPEHGHTPQHLLTLADLSVAQIEKLVQSAIGFKKYYKAREGPFGQPDSKASAANNQSAASSSSLSEAWGQKTLADKTVALMFSKRSTRTRVASETSVKLLGECQRLSREEKWYE